MAIYAAAYELGLNAVMLHYNLLYLPQFPWDPRAAGGRGIEDCLRWVEEDLEVLNVELSKDTSPLHAIVKKLRRLFAQRKRRQQHVPEAREKRIQTITSPWGQLVKLMRVTLHDCPRLYPWYCLGRAIMQRDTHKLH